MPEGDDTTTYFHHAGALGLGDRGQVAGQDAEQVHLGAGRDDRQPVQRRLGRRAQGTHPGQHRVNDGRRHDVTRVGEHLGDEERVAAGEPEQLAGIDVRRGGQFADRAGGEPGQPQPGGRGAAEHAEQTAQRMVPGQGVVAVGHQQHRGQAPHPGTEVAQHIKGRAVGPVDVFDDEHGRRRRQGQFVAHGGEHEIPIGPGRQRRDERPVRRGPGRIAQRPQGARREKVLARAGEDPRSASRRGQESVHKAGLADTGLAEHQHGRSPPRVGALDGRAEHLQLYLPLQQVRHHAPYSPTGPADR